MININQKIIVYIDNNNNLNWETYLANKLKTLKSINIEINCGNLDLSCTEINNIVKIANKHDCKIICFCSKSAKTIVSAQSLGYKFDFSFDNNSKNTLETNDKDPTLSRTHFHQGTVRSGEYLETPGDLLILGDVNPGAKVSAEGNIIIWGKLLGIAHAGSKGNSNATISALQLRPLQLRIAKKIARGPNEKTQPVIAEQARIASEEITIFPLEIT